MILMFKIITVPQEAVRPGDLGLGSLQDFSAGRSPGLGEGRSQDKQTKC